VGRYARYNAKTTPKVRGGKVQRKNRAALTPTCYNSPQEYPVFLKEKPGAGYRHLIRKHDLYRFVTMLPEWDELSKGINAVVLAPGRSGLLGWCTPGIVAIAAWVRDIEWEDSDEWFCREHEGILGKLDIPFEEGETSWRVAFTESSARAFQLIHVFIHELGHHHDRMATRSKRHAARGEPFAEQYARRHEDTIIQRYRNEFDLG
jgi:hypothetical protein